LELLNELLEEEGVIDVILFGSSVKGKGVPHDKDVLVVFSDKVPVRQVVRKEIDLKNLGYDAVCVKYRDLSKHSLLLRSVIHEGRSLKLGELSKLIGLESYVLFRYKNTKGPSNRVRLFRAFSEIDGIIKVGRGAVVVSVGSSSSIEDILRRLEIEYVKTPLFVPENFAKSEAFIEGV
jgi:predicted nucleotidyltransferase